MYFEQQKNLMELLLQYAPELVPKDGASVPRINLRQIACAEAQAARIVDATLGDYLPADEIVGHGLTPDELVSQALFGDEDIKDSLIVWASLQELNEVLDSLRGGVLHVFVR